MRERAVKLKDVAEAANISMAAVSRILRGHKAEDFNVDTQKRVLEAAERLGWRPNLLVQGLQTGQTGTLGVFVAPFNTHWTGVLYGIHDTILKADRVPLVLWPHALVHPTLDHDLSEEGHAQLAYQRVGRSPTDGDSGADLGGRREEERLLRMIDRRVDAVVSWPLFEPEAIQRMVSLSERGWPIVTIDDQLPTPATSSMVTVDEAEGLRQIAEHLAERGHRYVLYVGLERPHAWSHRRHRGFLDHVPGATPRHAMQVDTTGQKERGPIAEFLKQHPEATAVVAASDLLALQVIEVARGLGYDVPSRLSVIGYGNQVFDTVSVPLTTVEQNPYQIGTLAAQLAMGEAESSETGRRSIREIKPTLVVRDSTATVSVPA
ncbi:MAG: LacI family DNA-binding transcriptional regulator [Planctomycetota bacterium]